MNIRDQVALACDRIVAEQRVELLQLGYTDTQIDDLLRTGKAPNPVHSAVAGWLRSYRVGADHASHD